MTEGTASGIGLLGWKLLRWWGALFRMVFIGCIGLLGFMWFNPGDISDVPFAQLTLNMVVGRLLAVLISVGCVAWFLRFPERKSANDSRSNPYVQWGKFGGGLLLLVATAVFFFLLSD